MQLSELIDGQLEHAKLDIKGLALDSRDVRPGYLFAAFKGEQADGCAFIPDALKKGAVAVLMDDKSADIEGEGVVFIKDKNPRKILANMADKFFQPKPNTIVAITGTNGKTSVARFTRQLWAAEKLTSGSLGTLGVDSDVLTTSSGLTTPDTIQFHSTLSDLGTKGVTHMAVEASSHGLSQHRLDGVTLQAAAFTNLSREHLDYHKTIEQYFDTKARLFKDLLAKDGTAVIFLGDDFSTKLLKKCQMWGLKTLTVGETDKADIHIKSLGPHAAGQDIMFSYLGKTHMVSLPLVGIFQAWNALVAAGLLITTGSDPETSFKNMGSLTAIPGRMEVGGITPKGGRIFIDYAHTPDGFENVLRSLRMESPGRLSIVFGCGGDRDAGKRAEMGEVAYKLADRVYITDDNPRSEDPQKIRSQIKEGCPDHFEIPDRFEAILKAASDLEADDLLIITGKGRDLGQIMAAETLPYDEFETVERAVNALTHLQQYKDQNERISL